MTLKQKTPGGGFEPPTSSLTAKRSTTELPGNILGNYSKKWQ
jgi:hypothetical protein